MLCGKRKRIGYLSTPCEKYFCVFKRVHLNFKIPYISLNVRTVHVFVYVLLNVETALAVHTGTSKYGNFCDREVFTNFGKLKLVPKKEEKKAKKQ